jgi:hypothetical protein
MSPSVKNGLIGVVVIGGGFAAAIGFSVLASLCSPVLTQNESLVDAWRYTLPFFAIVSIRMLLQRGGPRLRVMP